jgi:hypothetical protein
MNSLFEPGHIIQIIAAPADMWAPQDGAERVGPTGHGFGTLVIHARVAYLALVEADKQDPDQEWDAEPRFDRWVEFRDGSGEPLDTLSYSASGPCELVKPGEWDCAGHFDPIDEAEYHAAQERRRLDRAAAKAVKASA